MFDRIVNWDNLRDAYNKTRKAKGKHKVAAIRFEQDAIHNLKMLQQSLIDGTYKCSGYNTFMVYEPKPRVIYAPHYVDKIVQHAINNVIRDHLEPKFIHDSYACIRGKGTHRAILAIQKHTRVCKRNHGDKCYFAKTDISKFFYTIDRDVLKRIVAKKIPCVSTQALLNIIIDSSPSDGLPLGNLTSQILANLYMNELDQYIKRHLKVRHYVRYADDLFMMCKDKSEAKRVLLLVRKAAKDILHLDTSDKKSFVTPVAGGIVGLGCKIFTTHISLLYKHKRGLIRCLQSVKSIKSWLSFTSIMNRYNFIKRILPDDLLPKQRSTILHNKSCIH